MDIPGMASKYRVVRFRNESSRQTLVKHQFLDPPLTICRGIFPKKKSETNLRPRKTLWLYRRLDPQTHTP